jgi:hypothetical protein
MLRESMRSLALVVIEAIYNHMKNNSFGGDTSGAEEYLRQAHESMEEMLDQIEEVEKETSKPNDNIPWGTSTRDDGYECGGSDWWIEEKYRNGGRH